MSKETEFLDEYAQLVKKHGVMVVSCGCCGGPYLRCCEAEAWLGDQYVSDPDFSIQVDDHIKKLKEPA